MPIYEYSCESCGVTIDLLQRVSDPAPTECGKCGAQGTLRKLVSRTTFQLKGGGWYSDLYSSKPSSPPASSEKPPSSAGTSATT